MPKLKKALIYSGCFSFIGVTVLLLARSFSWFGEWYASHIFPAFPETIGRLMSVIPFSVFEILVYALAACIALYILYFLLILIVPLWRRHVKKAALRAFCAALLIASFGFMMLILTCTVNYGRDTFAELTGRELMPHSKENLLTLCELLIKDLDELSEEIKTGDWGTLSLSDIDVKKEAGVSMRLLGQAEEVLAGYYPNPKPVIASKFMSMINITGVYSAFTVEANYNDHIPDYIIPYTICHELAHLKGFIREDEAGFIAYLACRMSQSAEFRYSGAVNALSYALNAYRREATPEEYAALAARVPAQVARDFWMGRAYFRQFQGKIAEIANKANDNYLKANAQKDGVKSYGRMVDLLLAEYRIGVIY